MGTLKGIFFDQDGVIIDTERDGHRVSFNETFKEFGFPVTWGVDEYHDLLQIAGGKERMKHYLQTKGFGKPVPPEEVDDLIARMHKRKTAMFIEMVESGRLPLRPGIHRFLREAVAAGLRLAVCTTSSEKAAHAIAYQILKDIHFEVVLAGDVVAKKKPDPEIYNLALQKTGLAPDDVLVVEELAQWRPGRQGGRPAGPGHDQCLYRKGGPQPGRRHRLLSGRPGRGEGGPQEGTRWPGSSWPGHDRGGANGSSLDVAGPAISRQSEPRLAMQAGVRSS